MYVKKIEQQFIKPTCEVNPGADCEHIDLSICKFIYYLFLISKCFIDPEVDTCIIFSKSSVNTNIDMHRANGHEPYANTYAR